MIAEPIDKGYALPRSLLNILKEKNAVSKIDIIITIACMVLIPIVKHALIS